MKQETLSNELVKNETPDSSVTVGVVEEQLTIEIPTEIQAGALSSAGCVAATCPAA